MMRAAHFALSAAMYTYTPPVQFSAPRQRILDHVRASVELQVLHEADTITALHEMHLSGDRENIRLAEEAHRHAAIATSAAWLTLFHDLMDMARAEVAAERLTA